MAGLSVVKDMFAAGRLIAAEMRCKLSLLSLVFPNLPTLGRG